MHLIGVYLVQRKGYSAEDSANDSAKDRVQCRGQYKGQGTGQRIVQRTGYSADLLDDMWASSLLISMVISGGNFQHVPHN